MNDERFFDLAMKVIACQCTDAERAELDALLTREPALRVEFARLEADARVAKDALPLVDATQAAAGELPAYARGRLQTKVRQTLGRPQTADDSQREREHGAMWAWRWWLGLAAATAVVVVVLLPTFTQPPGIVVEVAMIDVAGSSRGTDSNDVTALRVTWKNSTPKIFSSTEESAAWEKSWQQGERAAAKIIYDRAAGEVRVLGRWNGKPFQKTFLVSDDLKAALEQAQAFIEDRTKQ